MTFPIQAVRDGFPSLRITDDGKSRVYLDNPAGTQVPASVAQAAAECMLRTNANLGGYFPTSIAAGEIAERAHRSMATFLGAKSYREIVIGASMTELTFAFSRALARRFEAGDEIVVTRMDHDGNIAPWLAIAQDRGLNVRWVPFDERLWTIRRDELERALSSRTRVVALNYANNLTGSINDVCSLVDCVHAAGALAYIDAVQLAPHRAIDVAALRCDFLACSSYKFFGPHLGILWGREDLLDDLCAYKVRPQTSQLPWKFERGTPQIEQLAALEATVAYFERLGGMCGATGDRRECIERAFDGFAKWERDLTAQLLAGLSEIPGVKIVGIADPARYGERVPTVSFVHERLSPTFIAERLAERNLFVWSGHNFALETVRQLGIDEEAGVVRIGIAHYNTPDEITAVLEAIRRLIAP